MGNYLAAMGIALGLLASSFVWSPKFDAGWSLWLQTPPTAVSGPSPMRLQVTPVLCTPPACLSRLHCGGRAWFRFLGSRCRHRPAASFITPKSTTNRFWKIVPFCPLLPPQWHHSIPLCLHNSQWQHVAFRPPPHLSPCARAVAQRGAKSENRSTPPCPCVPAAGYPTTPPIFRPFSASAPPRP